jgi:hypothetical protein
MNVTVTCSEHGTQNETFVCEHLVHGKGLGFHFVIQADNPRPDGWCSDCEEIRQRVDGWNEESEKFIKVTLLCGECYDRARRLNSQ